MRLERCMIWDAGKNEYTHEKTFGAYPFLVPYIHEDEVKRPAVLVVPGGAYRFVSPTEGEPVAEKFYERGYQAFVVTYTTNMLGISPVGKQALNDLARAVRYIRYNKEKFRVMEDRVAICGFSAGGHAAASLCVHFDDVPDADPRFRDIPARPDLSILSYPVISGDISFTHRESIEMLLGKERTEEEILYASNEKNVKADTPPAFIWHTFDDATVPVRNSFEYAQALREKDIPVALHVFTSGVHGLATADGNSAVTEDNAYTYGPLRALKRALEEEKIRPEELDGAEDTIRRLDGQLSRVDNDTAVRNREAEVWTDLADQWMRNMW